MTAVGQAAPGRVDLPDGPRDPAGPAATVGMIGAGQLARMTVAPALALGIELRVFAHSGDDAAAAAARTVVGSTDRVADLLSFAEGCEVVTFEHERIPPAVLAELEAAGVPLAPKAAAKLMAQDKLEARTALAERGFPVPPFARIERFEDLERFAQEHGWPLVLKAARGGYDGRGVQVVRAPDEARAVLAGLSGDVLAEPLLELEREVAVIVARSRTGEAVGYPVVDTVQRDAICREIIAPAAVSGETAAAATELALAIAEAIDATGLMAVELFVTGGGLLLNELALRPHNSGHYTIEGCLTSQFEQHLRAVLGWPLGDPALTAEAVATVNVLGPADGSDPRSRVAEAAAVGGAHLHLYGKGARPGRKLGHVTALGHTREQALATARRAAAILDGSAAR